MSPKNDIFDDLVTEQDYQNFYVGDKNLDADVSFSGDIFDQISTSEKEYKDFGFLDTAKDVGQQIVSKGVSGLLGGYGNIAESLGLQLESNQSLPGESARRNIDINTLEKLNKGVLPSIGELMMLSEDESITRLPTSKEVQKGIEKTTGVGEGKTPLGRIAGRASEFIGEGISTGGGKKALLGLGASGTLGQSARELGAPEGVASGLEIATSFIPSMVSKKNIPLGKKQKELYESGKKIGLSEAQITPLIQSEKKISTLSKVAKKGTKTKELFSSIKESLGDSYSNIKKSVSNINSVGQKNNEILLDKFSSIKNDLQKTLAASPDKEQAIKFIDTAIKKIELEGASPESLINFWQDINKSVKWNSIQGGKKSLSRLKEPILDILKKVNPSSAKDFEMTNELYSKYSQIAKQLKPDVIDTMLNKTEILALPASGIALLTGNPWPLKALATEKAIRTLSREMLINPYFQNISKKLVKDFNQSSFKGLTSSVNQVREYMERKHPDENWSFLTEDNV